MSENDILPAPEIQSLPATGPSKWEREKLAFRRLSATHRGQYVAVHNEQVVDSGSDQLELARQSYRRFGYVPVYVGLVTDEPREPIRMPSPRHVRGRGQA